MNIIATLMEHVYTHTFYASTHKYLGPCDRSSRIDTVLALLVVSEGTTYAWNTALCISIYYMRYIHLFSIQNKTQSLTAH